MDQYRYNILAMRIKKEAIRWVLMSKPNTSLGTNVITILNKLGAKGWEVVGTGNFVGDARSEIMLKQTRR